MSRSYFKVGVFLIWKLEFKRAKASWKPQKSSHKAAALNLNLFCLLGTNSLAVNVGILTWCVCA